MATHSMCSVNAVAFAYLKQRIASGKLYQNAAT